MEAQLTRSSFIERVRVERARWDALLAEIGEARMEEPGVGGGDWTVKDNIAHITWHEKEMLGMLRARRLHGSELWNLPLQERNTAIFEQNRGRSLQDVLAEAREVYPELLRELEKLDDTDLTDPGRIAEMPADWTLAALLEDNTYEHYADHVAGVRAWLDRVEGGRR
jgi:hypothetical protein